MAWRCRSAICCISALRAGAISTTAPSGATAAPGGSKDGSRRAGAGDEAQRAGLRRAPTQRSRQRPPALTYWRIGKASNNSLATMSSGCSRQVGDGHRARRRRLRRRRQSVACCTAAKPRAGLDEVRCRRRARRRGSSLPQRAQHILHQGAAARPDLGERRRGSGRPARLPGADQPDADQLAEHLADLRRGDEVAGAAERLARRVVAVLRDRTGRAPCSRRRESGPLRLDQPRRSVALERRHARRWSAASCRPRRQPSPRRRPAPSDATAPCPWSASRRTDSRAAGRARGRTRRRCAPARSRRRRRRRRSRALFSLRKRWVRMRSTRNRTSPPGTAS